MYMFCIFVGIDFVDLTWEKIHIYEKSFQMCIWLWRSFIVLVWTDAADRLKSNS